jgi:hypothetical protein
MFSYCSLIADVTTVSAVHTTSSTLISKNQRLSSPGLPFTYPVISDSYPENQDVLNTNVVNLIRLHVSTTANTYSDEMIVNFNSSATPAQGVVKWFSMFADAPSLYSVKNGINYTINTLVAVSENLIVPVSFIAGVNGSYTISAGELNSFTTTTYIYLKDLKTNYIQALNQNASYTFTGLTTDNYARFQLIFALAPCGWLGNNSTDWSNAANWVNGLQPTISDNIILNAWAANQPHITANATSPSICNNLHINTGASLCIDAGKALTVNGTISNNAGNSGLILKSDATANASIIHNSTNVNATVERYIAKDNSWHFMASPVANQVIKPNFAPVISDLTFDFYKWDETTPITGLPWINIRDVNGNYTPGFDNFETARGYLVAYSNAYNGNAIHIFNGILNSGNQTIPVTFGINNYNLIGNPFPSAMDWSNTNLQSNVSSTLGFNPPIWIWNQSAGNYGVFANGSGGTNSVTNVIAPHQAFFVLAIANASLSFPNSARIHPGNQNFLKTTYSNLLKLHVNSTINTYSDEMIVNFDSTASPDQGVIKWFSMIPEAPSLFSVKNGNKYSINTLAALTDNLMVTVGFMAGVNATFTINATELNSFENTTTIYLKDLKTNTTTDFSQNSSYTFSAVTTDSVNRFQLQFKLSPAGIIKNDIQSASIYSNEHTVYINTAEPVQEVIIYNSLGQIIKTIKSTGCNHIINMKENQSGCYIVKVVCAKNVYSEKVIIK